MAKENRRKKVLLISGSSKPIPAVEGGAVESLTEKLIQNNKDNDEVELFVLSESNDSMITRNPHYLFYPPKKSSLKEFSRKLHNLFFQTMKYTYIKQELLESLKVILEQKDFDEVIVLNYGVYCSKIRAFYNGKISLFLHNDYLNQQSYQYKQTLAATDRVISVSAFIENKVKSLMTSDELEFSIVENGIDLNQYIPISQEEKERLQKQLDLSGFQFVFLFSGRIDKSKGVRELVSAFKDFNQRDVVLIIAGAPAKSYKKQFLKSIEDNQVTVKYIGKQSQHNLVKYYQVADLCIIPSIVEESFCLVNIEAQACNTPVIATKSGALRDYYFGQKELSIEANRDNLRDELSKAMVFFKDNAKYLKTIDYRKHAKKYSVDHMYGQFLQEVSHS